MSFTLEQKKRIRDYKRSGGSTISQKDIGDWAKTEFNISKPIPQPTLSKILREKTPDVETEKSVSQHKKRRHAKHPKPEEALSIWIYQREERSEPVNWDMIVCAAKHSQKDSTSQISSLQMAGKTAFKGALG